jgi:glycosyltransferase involved in cell wall biosynthesis
VLGDAAVYVAPGDPDALARALRSLAEDPDRLAGARAAARQLARDHFTPAQVVGPLHDRLLAVVPPEV